MKKKFLIVLLAVITAITCAFGIASCKSTPHNNDNNTDSHKHNWAVEWDNDTFHHWHDCTADGCTVTNNSQKDSYATHSWDNGTVTKQATCKDTGIKTFTCTVCHTTKTESVDKLTTHTWDSGEVTKQATCKDTGIKTFTCTVCHTTKTESILKTSDHRYGVWTSDGENTHSRTCSVCGNTEQEDHHFNEPVYAWERYKCTICNHIKTVKITKIDIKADLITINVGDSFLLSNLYCDIYPTNYYEKKFLKTDNSDILSIDDTGITAKKIGTANIYIESESGVKSDLCAINCVDVTVPEYPMQLQNWTNPAYSVTQTANISEIKINFVSSVTNTSSLRINCYVKLNKINCIYSGSYEFKINYKLKDSSGTVIKSGTLTSAKFSVGETVVLNGNIYVDSSLIKGEQYSIEFFDVAW